MTSEQNTVDPYELVLRDLYAKRAQIETAITAIEALRSGNAAVAAVSQAAPAANVNGDVQAGMFAGLSIAEAAKRLLAMKKQPMTTPEILAGLLAGGVVFSTATPGNTVGSVLHRETRQGNDVVSIGRGKWALSALIKNPGRFQKKGAKGEPLTEDAEGEASGADASEPAPPSGPYPRAVGE